MKDRIIYEIIIGRENGIVRRKPYSSTTILITNPKWTALKLSRSPLGEKPAINSSLWHGQS
jgi:hypothetical protein